MPEAHVVVFYLLEKIGCFDFLCLVLSRLICSGAGHNIETALSLAWTFY